MAARTTTIVLTLAAAAAAQATCSAKVAAAIQTVSGDGSSVACCAVSSAHCSLSLTGDCSTNEDQPNVAWCLGAGGSKACVISYSDDEDAPCGVHTGTIGPSYGLTPVADNYRYSFGDSAIQDALIRNWERLSTLSDVSLCTSSDDALAAGAAGPHIGSVERLSQNPCNPGEFNVKCYGTATDGLCMVYNNVTTTSDTGVYLLVNLDPTAPQAASSTPHDTSTGTTVSLPTSSVTTSTPAPVTAPPADGSAKSSVNLAAIIVPIVVGLLLVALAIFFILRRRSKKHQDESDAAAPTPFTPVAASMSEMSQSGWATQGHTSYPADDESGLQAWTASSRSRLQREVSQSSIGNSYHHSGSPPPVPAIPFAGKRGMGPADTNRHPAAGSEQPPPLYTPQ